MIELVCIACPNSCNLVVEKTETDINVSGHKCKRGVDFAKNELISPMRSVSTTVKCSLKGVPTVAVRTDGEIPKDKIMPLMRFLRGITIDSPCEIGFVLVENFDDTNVNIIVTSNTYGGQNE